MADEFDQLSRDMTTTMARRRIGLFFFGRVNNGGTEIPLPGGGSCWVRVEELTSNAWSPDALWEAIIDHVAFRPGDTAFMNSHDLVAGPWDSGRPLIDSPQTAQERLDGLRRIADAEHAVDQRDDEPPR